MKFAMLVLTLFLSTQAIAANDPVEGKIISIYDCKVGLGYVDHSHVDALQVTLVRGPQTSTAPPFPKAHIVFTLAGRQ